MSVLGVSTTPSSAAFLQPASELVAAQVQRISRPFEAGAAAAQ